MNVERAFASQLTMADFMAANVTLGAATVWTELGSYTVPRGQAVKLGYGRLEGQDTATGRLYYDIIDDTAGNATAEDGLIRIVAVNPTQTKSNILFQGSTTKGRSGDADSREKQIPFPEHSMGWVPQDWTIRIQMKPNAAGDIVQYVYSVLLMDCMVADLIV